MNFKNKCEVVIIGGGIAGCSVAYHLAKLNKTDVTLLERHQLTSGTTWLYSEHIFLYYFFRQMVNLKFSILLYSLI